MSKSICVQCGKSKQSYLDRCDSCGFLPASDEDFARGLLLSTEYENDSLDLPKSEEELNLLRIKIEAGQSNIFDEKEVERAVKFLEEMRDFQNGLNYRKLIFMIIFPVLTVLVAVFYFISKI